MPGESVIPQHVYQPVPFVQATAEVVVHDPANPMVLIQDLYNPNRSIWVLRSQLVPPQATPRGISPGGWRSTRWRSGSRA
ncbi:hypothetical protein [Streptomyces sp. NPDC002580]|uniref:hypothetical protein n=1 Tax=Streptomyces sp. NPDC002580 TaxID=3364653 RepID=UPI0036AB2112